MAKKCNSARVIRISQTHRVTEVLRVYGACRHQIAIYIKSVNATIVGQCNVRIGIKRNTAGCRRYLEVVGPVLVILDPIKVKVHGPESRAAELVAKCIAKYALEIRGAAGVRMDPQIDRVSGA